MEVIPAKAGIHTFGLVSDVDSGVRRNDVQGLAFILSVVFVLSNTNSPGHRGRGLMGHGERCGQIPRPCDRKSATKRGSSLSGSNGGSQPKFVLTNSS